ncbi:MAG TPA: hypothetical protein VIQ99_09215 [Gammaproteobacteria bacterium]
MGSLLTCRRIVPALAALIAAAAVGAESDRHELTIDVSAGYVSASTDLAAWPEGGLSKLRVTEDGLTAFRAFVDYRGRLTPTLHARVIADYVDDGSSGLDLTEAYIDWRPIPSSPNQHQVRFGAFYPPLSLENGDAGWQSPFTYSYSAINTWLGEEIRPVGAEWSLRRRFERLGNAQELRAFAAGFYGNDPAGTLLFWRGWSLHDRQSRLHDHFDIPDMPTFSNGVVTGTREQTLKPFVDTDHEPGAYAGVEWRYARRALVQLARYDNRADPYSFADGQWGWRTDFDHLAVQVGLPAEIGLVAQWMHGTTDWLTGASQTGTLSPFVRFVQDEFESKFVMLTRRLGGAHRLALRYDTFSINRLNASPPLESDDGDAWTLSYRLAPESARFSGGIEWLRIDSHRDIFPTFYFVAADQTEDQLRLQFSYRLAAP